MWKKKNWMRETSFPVMVASVNPVELGTEDDKEEEEEDFDFDEDEDDAEEEEEKEDEEEWH